jgi:hypothetical protein
VKKKKDGVVPTESDQEEIIREEMKELLARKPGKLERKRRQWGRPIYDCHN